MKRKCPMCRKISLSQGLFISEKEEQTIVWDCEWCNQMFTEKELKNYVLSK